MDWRKFIILGCIILAGSIVGEAAFLNVDKMKIVIDNPAGETVPGVITVQNQEDYPLTVKVYPMAWRYVSPYDGKKEFFSVEDIRAEDVLLVTPREFVLEPGERRLVRYKVNIPSQIDTPMYLVLFFETDAVSSSHSARMDIRLVTRVGTLFFIEPKGVASYHISSQGCAELKEDGVHISLLNDGNTALVAQISAFLLDERERFLCRTGQVDVYVPAGDNFSVVLPLKGQVSDSNKAKKVLLTVQAERSEPVSLDIQLCM